MAKYYGVERSEEYFAHYGVRGMKWGVRRSIEKGNGDRLRRHAIKASQKLAKLKLKADIVRQAQEYKGYKNLVKSGASIAGLGAGAGLIAYGTGHFNHNTAEPIGAVTGAGLGMATSAGISALIRRHRLSSKGHGKAVQKVRDWQNNMNESFKGTKYAKLAGKKYKDEYAIDKLAFNPKTGKVSRKRVVTLKGEQLTRDYAGPVTPKWSKPRHAKKHK